MSAIAGRVLLIPKGNYDSTATYTMLDMVVYNGSSYICKQECTGVVPTNTTYWMLNASGSAVAYINDIGDVVITNPTNGQVLMYDSTTQKWVNGTLTLNSLTDTQFASLTNGQVLKYNSTSQKWENADNLLSSLSDANISSAINGQALLYNSTTQKWENANISSTLAGLTDTEITSPTNEQALVYNSATQKWENGVSGTVRYNEQTDWVQIYYNGNWVNWKLGDMQLDPTKMELTQDEFITICGRGLQKYMSVGAIIHVNNEYCNTLEVIDVEHDGVLNSVDVMAHTQVAHIVFGTAQNYNTSGVREWINSTYIDAFDYDVRKLMKVQQVVTMGTTQNDKAKLLSWKEIGLTNYYMDNTDGGTKYPVFTAGTYDVAILNRWRSAGNYGNDSYLWTRSRYTDNSNYVWVVNSPGTCGYGTYASAFGVLPVLRF